MHRRDFIRVSAAAAAALNVVPAQPAPAAATKALMKVGTQHSSAEEVLPILSAFGVNHICSTLPSAKMDERWSVESLTKLRERVEKHGIKLEMVPLPLSSSSEL